MPSLGPRSPLPWRPRRILVAGSSGAGKSTMAARIAALLGIEYTELDALHHGPGWQRRESFVDDVHALVEEPAWITDWQYSDVRDLTYAHADTVVWLAYPRRVVFTRLAVRTVRRRVRRESLWNGNVEPPLRTVFTERDHVLRYAWRHFRKRAAELERMHREADPGHKAIVVLRAPAEAHAWVDGPLRGVLPRS